MLTGFLKSSRGGLPSKAAHRSGEENGRLTSL